MVYKKEIYSSLLVGLSFIIFSVGVPLIQERIDAWKEQREIYFGNLLNTEFQRLTGRWAVNLYETVDIIKKSPIASDPESEKVIDEIKKLYLAKAKESIANAHFLETEPVYDNKKPNKERYDEIKKKIESKSPLIRQEANSFLDNFNQDYKRGLARWSKCRNIAYFIAIIFYFWGMWLALKARKDPNSNLIKENQNLITRINILIKKLNKKI